MLFIQEKRNKSVIGAIASWLGGRGLFEPRVKLDQCLLLHDKLGM